MIPNKKTLHHGWGKGRSSHIVGPDLKPLPKSLKITFFSYTEDKFYRGRFDLPYEKILSMFQEGYISPRDGERITYDQIIAGVAPGGAVSVWLSGIDKSTEIFYGKAEEDKDIKWTSIVDNPDITREEFIQIEIKDSLKTPEAVEALRKKGIPIGRWKNYHKKCYQWYPVFNNVQVRHNRIYPIKYFNGERNYFYLPLEESLTKPDRAVPSELRFIWDREKGQDLLMELLFDEKEIFEVFEKLGSNKQQIILEIRRVIVEKQENFYFLLRNSDEEIYLRNTKVETYGAPK